MPKIPYNKRKDGRYYKQIIIGVDENGKRKVKTLYDRNWRVLDKKVREFQVDLGQGKYIEKNITFGECAELWWNLTKKGLKTNSLCTYQTTLNKLKPLRHMKIRDLKPMHLQNFYSEMYEQKIYSTIKSVAAIIDRILEFAVDNNFAVINIAKKTPIPQAPRKSKSRRCLTNEEKKLY